MTPEQIAQAKALVRCTFLPGSYDKRFAKDMAFYAVHQPGRELTEKQAALLEKMMHRYRRQLARIVT
ncbi:MAG: hypothetical protein HUU31_24340 [Anaerolineae bacterium]|nr:hypothetical protein [Anaerolineae bacterium]